MCRVAESEGRPLSPHRQLVIMKEIENEQKRLIGEPSEQDLKVR